MKTPPDPPDLITAHAIAKQLERSPQGVIDAIARLGLKPAARTDAGNLYPPETVDKVRAAMRQRNRTKATPQG